MRGLDVSGEAERPRDSMWTGLRMDDENTYDTKQVSESTGIKRHVIHYWTSQFSQLSPERNDKDELIFAKKDVALLVRLRRLIYDMGYTIEGAKKRLADE